MATITLQIVAATTTVTVTRTASNANARRVMDAERINLETVDDQTTLQKMLDRAIAEWVGDTKTVERNAAVIADIPIT